MPTLTSITLDPVIGYITDVVNPAPGPRGSHQYVGIVQTPEGQTANVSIGPSSVDGWDLPHHVRPLQIGKAIEGIRVNGSIQWHYHELPKTGICGPGIGGGSGVVSPLMYMSKDQLRWLKRALAEVDE
ncbi:MAG: hypothetical protein IT438_16500 [Phycisphaerales bacterium]|nr:hypothetical protein [Phycisphaerales bacterium]